MALENNPLAEKSRPNGRELYEIYAFFQLDRNNCSVDDWDNLAMEDQAAWEAVAESVEWGK